MSKITLNPLRWYHAYTRKFDEWILWPSLRKQASTLERAREGFLLHCSIDPAWKELGYMECMKRVYRFK